jgi:hypothetical protein
MIAKTKVVVTKLQMTKILLMKKVIHLEVNIGWNSKEKNLNKEFL